MTHSIYSADRMTHLKIGVTALIAGIVVVSVGIAIRLSPDGIAGTTRVIKASEIVTIVSSSANLVR